MLKRHMIVTVFFCLCAVFGSVAMAETVGRGDRGDQVLQVQQMLIKQGYLIDTADGIFGNNTEYSVRTFQKDHKLAVTGSVDAATLRAMKENNKRFADKPSQPSQASKVTTRKPAVQQESRNVRSEVVVSRYGDRGRNVEDLQLRLANSGFSPGDIDGIYGRGTESAIKAFQKEHGLPATGVVDAKTADLLSKEVGMPSSYKKVLTMNASAYSAEDPGNTAYTARGNLLRRGYVSVDPNVIPLGTRVYVEGYGYAVADDIGGAIVGNRIDLAMDSHGEAINFGRRTVTVYIL